MKDKILLAYSGGLDTSAIIPWLKDTYNADVIAYCSDLGNAPDKETIGNKAYELGASEFIFEDVQDMFASNFIFPMMRSGAIYQDDYLLGTAIARPLIAERLVHWANKKGAYAIAHGATGKGNDQIRFERGIAYLNPKLKIIAPWKIWDFKGREDLSKYLNSKGFPYEDKDKVYSEDVNLLHRSCEGGILENVEQAYPAEDVLKWVNPEIEKKSGVFTASFKHGLLIKINGKEVDPLQGMEQLNCLGKEYGVGITDLVEERFNGVKSRGIYETPGGTILYTLVKTLKHICWDKTTQKISRRLADDYADLVYDGKWHSTARKSLEAFFQESGKYLEGEVSFKIINGKIIIDSRTSPYSLYDKKLVSFEDDEFGLNEASNGFCKTIIFSSQLEGTQNENFTNKS